MNIAATITETIDCIRWNNGDCITSYPIDGTHPYERLGKFIKAEIYRRCKYKIEYSTQLKADLSGDRVVVIHRVTPFLGGFGLEVKS